MLTQQSPTTSGCCASSFVVATCPSPEALATLLLSLPPNSSFPSWCPLTRCSVAALVSALVLLFPYGLPEISLLRSLASKGPPPPSSVSILGLSLGQTGFSYPLL